MSHRLRTWPALLGLAALWLAQGTLLSAAEVEDAEASTHGFEAAAYETVGNYEFPGFKLIQFDLAVLSHYSYMLVSDDKCLVVDPGRDIFTYIETAEKEQVEIIGVWLTHSHADFVAGHVEFASKLGVPLRISRKAEAGYDHIALAEGDSLEVGQAVVNFLETPGHTPDSMCGLVSSKQEPDKPLALLTGDTLFVGSVGRPDLLGEGMSASTLASMMFDTWNNKLSKLPDDVVILPAHGAGSLCGAHLGDEPSSTIGDERVANTYLQYRSRGEFIAAILEGLPEAPQYFGHNAAMNKAGPAVVDWKPAVLPTVEPTEDLLDPSKYYVVDVRSAEEHAAGHIPNSVNIALRGRLETWTGIMVPWGADVVTTGSAEEVQESLYRLHRVGYEARCLLFDTWTQAKMPVQKNETITPRELHAQIQTRESPVVVDVRLPAEWAASRIGTVVNFPLRHLTEKAVNLNKQQRVITVCNSAYRSSMAVGVLERLGFGQVSNMVGGEEAWVDEGLPIYQSRSGGSSTVTPRREIRLAERISAAELKRLMMDLPGTFQLVDIRPSRHFADYHLPESENVDVAVLLDSEAYLRGAGPLIVVCRDGSLSMMVAGILSQKTDRNIKALYGGLDAYWTATSPGGGGVGGVSAGPAQGRSPAPRDRRTGQFHRPSQEEESGVLTMSTAENPPDVPQGGRAAYWNPYLAGLLLGAALLASFVLLGAGLGASSAPARLGACLQWCVAPASTVASPYFGRWFEGDANPLSYYLVYMFVGVFVGGLCSAAIARRIHFTVERGQAFPAGRRLLLALCGGVLVGFASRLAGGCTSGQALTGGALLLNGSIVFLICVFAGGYAVAWFLRSQWHD